MSSEVRISVLMSVHNDAPFLRESVESILGQTEGRFEFLIVDDGSTDGSSEILEGYAASDPRIRLLRQENRGLIPSLNRLIEEARAPLIARMDGDDISLPDRFAHQLAHMEAHPDIAVLGGTTYDLDAEGHVSDCRSYFPISHEAIMEGLRTANVICHPSVMMRRAALDQVGGYRAAFRHCEDYDLWLRIGERFELANMSEKLIYYRRSPGQVSQQHTHEQAVGAVFALLAHKERIAGRPDPFEGIDALPQIRDLDTVFGRPGMATAARAAIIPRIQYSRESLAGPGLAIMKDHLRSGGEHEGYWRTALRMVKYGLAMQAFTLAVALMAD